MAYSNDMEEVKTLAKNFLVSCVVLLLTEIGFMTIYPQKSYKLYITLNNFVNPISKLPQTSLEKVHVKWFNNNENDTITDKRNYLMWIKKDNGQDVNWEQAKKYCEQCETGNFTNWRLPTMEELFNLYDENYDFSDQGNNNYLHLIPLIELSSYKIWASDVIREGTKEYVRYLNFARGYTNKSKNIEHTDIRALCVRGPVKPPATPEYFPPSKNKLLYVGENQGMRRILERYNLPIIWDDEKILPEKLDDYFVLIMESTRLYSKKMSYLVENFIKRGGRALFLGKTHISFQEIKAQNQKIDICLNGWGKEDTITYMEIVILL